MVSLDELIKAGEVKEYPDGAYRWLAGNSHFMHPGTYYQQPPQANTFGSDQATAEAGKRGGSVVDPRKHMKGLVERLNKTRK